jgi:conjugative transfer signal peptidase TraF
VTTRGRRLSPSVVGALRAWLLLASLAAASLGAPRLLPLAWNRSPSLPHGLYLRARGGYAPGTLVLACLPAALAAAARRRGYLDPGTCPGGASPVGKVVLAAGPDVVDFRAGGLRVNGLSIPGSGPVSVDSRSRPLAHVPFGRYRLAPGEVWLYSPYHPRSFDSRYFGPLREGDLRSTLVPLWIASRGLPEPPGFRLRLGSSHVD